MEPKTKEEQTIQDLTIKLYELKQKYETLTKTHQELEAQYLQTRYKCAFYFGYLKALSEGSGLEVTTFDETFI